jgi:hypothetical protein
LILATLLDRRAYEITLAEINPTQPARFRLFDILGSESLRRILSQAIERKGAPRGAFF